MTNFRKKQEAAESNTKKILGKIANNNKTPRLVESQNGIITNNFSEGDIYMSDDAALKFENKCLKKSLEEKERIISALKEEIELLKEMLGKR